jgi:hypothetical protein
MKIKKIIYKKLKKKKNFKKFLKKKKIKRNLKKNINILVLEIAEKIISMKNLMT